MIRGDQGFTLPEVLISMLLMAMISSVMVGVVAVVLRSAPTTEARTDDARTLQGLVTWLPQDVDSTPTGGFSTDPAAASGCTSSSGTNLLRLEWTENAGGGTVRFIANYRHVVLNGGYRIQRITCSGSISLALPLATTMAIGMTSEIAALPLGWAPGDPPVGVTIAFDPVTGDVVLVTFRIQTLQGKTMQTESAPKNPSDTLAPTTTVDPPMFPTTTTASAPTTTVPSGPTTTVDPLVPTSTSISTTTTTTVPPCVVTGGSLTNPTPKNTPPLSDGNGKAATNVGVLSGSGVILTITTIGYCQGLEARYDAGASNAELFRNFGGSGPTYSVVLPGYTQGSSELWADGIRALLIHDARGGPYASVTMTVK